MIDNLVIANMNWSLTSISLTNCLKVFLKMVNKKISRKLKPLTCLDRENNEMIIVATRKLKKIAGVQ